MVDDEGRMVNGEGRMASEGKGLANGRWEVAGRNGEDKWQRWRKK